MLTKFLNILSEYPIIAKNVLGMEKMLSNNITCRLLPVFKKLKTSEVVMVAHTCNPSFSGGGNWEDHSLRTDQVKS
jgi:hypothetical protein